MDTTSVSSLLPATAMKDTAVRIPPISKFSSKELFDIVIYTQIPGNLFGFLEKWKVVFQDCDIITVIEGNESLINSRIKEDFKIVMYNREDIERLMGEKAGCISKGDSTAKCFGFLMSKKKFIFSVDVDCLVAKDQAGKDINPIIKHNRNLLYPSTPYFANPTYDPYEPGNGFSLGYPIKLREGVPTAISHGLWLNVPHYDAACQIAKPLDRNFRYVNAVITIPQGILYPMCGCNLAFNRELIGPAMFFGLMGENQPLSGYGEIWAGFCTKVICDHLRLGVKSGLPYVWQSCRDDAVGNCKRDLKWIEWQDKINLFFRDMKFPEECDDVEKCYRHLAEQVKGKLGVDEQYFVDLADAMVTWIDAWYVRNPRGEQTANWMFDEAERLGAIG